MAVHVKKDIGTFTSTQLQVQKQLKERDERKKTAGIYEGADSYQEGDGMGPLVKTLFEEEGRHNFEERLNRKRAGIEEASAALKQQNTLVMNDNYERSSEERHTDANRARLTESLHNRLIGKHEEKRDA